MQNDTDTHDRSFAVIIKLLAEVCIHVEPFHRSGAGDKQSYWHQVSDDPNAMQKVDDAHETA